MLLRKKIVPCSKLNGDTAKQLLEQSGGASALPLNWSVCLGLASQFTTELPSQQPQSSGVWSAHQQVTAKPRSSHFPFISTVLPYNGKQLKTTIHPLAQHHLQLPKGLQVFLYFGF